MIGYFFFLGVIAIIAASAYALVYFLGWVGASIIGGIAGAVLVEIVMNYWVKRGK